MSEPKRPKSTADDISDDFHPELLDVPAVSWTQNGVQTQEEHEEAAPDPIDVASLRLSQDFSALHGLQPLLTTVPVRNPSKEWWIRVHDNPAYHFPTALIMLKESGERGETYLVSAQLWPRLTEESTFAPFQLYTAITRQQEVFLWPIRLPGPDGKVNEWAHSAHQAALLAQSTWVRVQSKKQGQGYNVSSSVYTDPPRWPDVTIEELINLAFRDRYIKTWDHPVLQHLR
jgi:hypothetical protein